MNFVYPNFLWALLSLLIPIIIHLLQLRKTKTIYFSNNRLLKDIQLENKSKQKLRNILVLICRCLALSALIIAFCQPYIGENKNTTSTYILYLDNSASMMSGEIEEDLFSEAKITAKSFLNQLGPDSRIHIFTNNFESSSYYNHSPEIALKQLMAIESSGPTRSLNHVLEHISGISSESQFDSSTTVLLFSDLQLSGLDAHLSFNKAFNYWIFESKHNEILDNTFIDSCYFDQALLLKGLNQQLNVSVNNKFSSKKFTGVLSLKNSTQTIYSSNIEIAAKEIRSFILPFNLDQSQDSKLEVKISAPSPSFDNHLTLTTEQQKKSLVFIISTDKSQTKSDDFFDSELFEIIIQSPQAIDFKEIEKAQLIIIEGSHDLSSGLVQSIENHLSLSKNILIFPSNELRSTTQMLGLLGMSYFKSLEETNYIIDKINWQDPLFSNVFTQDPKNPSINKIKKYFTGENPRGYPLLTLENGDPIIERIPKLNANVILAHFGLSEAFGTIAKDPILVPLAINTVIYSNDVKSSYYYPGSILNMNIPTSNVNDAIIKLESKSYSFIPQQKMNSNNINLIKLESNTPIGWYDIIEQDSIVSALAINTDRKESQWSFSSAQNMISTYPNYKLQSFQTSNMNASSFNELLNKVELWRYFLLLALFFFIIEILLLKFLVK